MKRLMLLAALPFLAHAASAQASFVQELGSPLPVEADPYDVVAADFNKDGRPDLAVANGTAGSISILLRQTGRRIRPRRCGDSLAESEPARWRSQISTPTRDWTSRAANYILTATDPQPTTPQTIFMRNPTTGFSQESGAVCASLGSSPSWPATSAVTGSPTSRGAARHTDAIYVFKRNPGVGFAQEGAAAGITTARP